MTENVFRDTKYGLRYIELFICRSHRIVFREQRVPVVNSLMHFWRYFSTLGRMITLMRFVTVCYYLVAMKVL